MKRTYHTTIISALALICSANVIHASEVLFEEILGGDSAVILSGLKTTEHQRLPLPEAQPAEKAAPARSELAVLEIFSREKISLRAAATYIATNEIMGCAQTSFTDGQMETIPLLFTRDIPITAGAGSSVVTFALNLPGKCRSALVGFTLLVNHPKVSASSNAIGLQLSQTNQDVNIQQMVFKKVHSPGLGEIWTIAGKSILVGPNGKAKAEIVLE